MPTDQVLKNKLFSLKVLLKNILIASGPSNVGLGIVTWSAVLCKCS